MPTPIEIEFEKRIVKNKPVREADTRSHRDYIFVTALAMMFLFGLFAYGWQHYQWIQYRYRIEEAQKKKEQLSEVGRQLRLERALLRNPQRIDTIARRDLGMVSPAPGQLLTLSAGVPPTIPTPSKGPVAPQTTPQQAQVQPQPAALAAKR